MKILNFILTVFLAVFFCEAAHAENRKIIEERGGKVIKYDDGSWQLLVDGNPYFIKGILYTPVKIGESPGEATMRDWMYYGYL
ncbi:MAG: hypothetical protein HY810_04100 [Candidatus Omnitrophica bacterium]|nr:hypothetical protein [Candidatus Omnitrophota bacterium]